MKFTRQSVVSIVLVAFWIGTGAQAQNVSIDDYQRAEQFLSSNVSDLVFRANVDPQWASDTPQFWYNVQTRRGTEYFFVDADQQNKRPFFDHVALADSLSEAFGTEVEAYELPLSNLQWDQADQSFTFLHEEQTWRVDLESLEVTAVEEPEESVSDKRIQSKSPDGKWIVTRKEYNLLLKNSETGEEYFLTHDGKKNQIYGATLPWAWKKQEGPTVEDREPLPLSVSWSEDSKKLVAYQLDLRNAKLMYLLQHVPEEGIRAKSFSYYRALPGENGVAKLTPYIFEIENQTKTRIQVDSYDNIIAGYWNWYGENSDELYTVIRERGYGSATLLHADAVTGKVDTVFSEISETFVDPNKSGWEFLPETDEFLWLSERDGWNHIYLVDLATGSVKQQVTRGSYVVYDIEHVDKSNRKVFFTAGGRESDRDPYYVHLYSVNFDGSELKLLTPENATHNISFSPDFEYFVDSYSRVDLKPKTVLKRSSDGSLLMEFEEADIDDLLAAGWQYHEPFSLKARDGTTDIYGVIIRPSDFDPDQKYPVIDATYSGPQAVRTPKSFGRGYRNGDQPLAELGFIIITVDGLGTAGRSKAFQDYSWKNLGDIGSADHIKAIKDLSERYTYMDTTRVGIYGHSAGGYDAARAILKHPDFYKVAVASAGNHDHRIAKAWWPELYMDYPAGSQYEEQSNVNLAGNLKGKLLLAHGDMDDNVHPAGTFRLANALIEAGKNFDMLIMPNKTHRLGNPNHYFTIKRWNYFVRHLLGAEPIWHYASTLTESSPDTSNN